METIGSIVALDGRVTGVDQAGHARALRVGDPVHSDETLVTALGATVTVRFVTGSELSIEPGRLVVLDADVFDAGDDGGDGAVRLTDLDLVLGWSTEKARSSAA